MDKYNDAFLENMPESISNAETSAAGLNIQEPNPEILSIEEKFCQTTITESAEDPNIHELSPEILNIEEKFRQMTITEPAENPNIREPSPEILSTEVKLCQISSTESVENPSYEEPSLNVLSIEEKFCQISNTESAENPNIREPRFEILSTEVKFCQISSTESSENPNIREPSPEIFSTEVKFCQISSTESAENPSIDEPSPEILSTEVKFYQISSTEPAKNSYIEEPSPKILSIEEMFCQSSNTESVENPSIEEQIPKILCIEENLQPISITESAENSNFEESNPEILSIVERLSKISITEKEPQTMPISEEHIPENSLNNNFALFLIKDENLPKITSNEELPSDIKISALAHFSIDDEKSHETSFNDELTFENSVNKEKCLLDDQEINPEDLFNLSSSTRIESTLELSEVELSSNSSINSSSLEFENETSMESSTSPGTEFDGSGDRDFETDSFSNCAATFVTPDKDLVDKILKQVEFYFSDENLKKDNFLLKHVCRTKEGNVSLKLVSSFRKLKALTKDWRVVAFSLSNSETLYVNKEGTKIKRKEPLSEECKVIKISPNKFNRTIVAFNLPFDKPTSENVAELFAKFGAITLVRILSPGVIIPPDIKKAMLNTKHPEIGSSVCAIIEFEEQESAIMAINGMDAKNLDWRSLHVVPLLSPSKEAKQDSISLNKSLDTECYPEKIKKLTKKGKKDKLEVFRMNESGDSNASICSEREWTPKVRGPFPQQGPYNKPHFLQAPYERRLSYGKSYGNKSNEDPVITKEVKYKPNVFSKWTRPLPSGGSPWVQRRIQAARESGINNASSSLRQTFLPDGLARLPRGPDGTGGFSVNYRSLRSFPEETN